MLIVENAGQWPTPARFQVWNSPLGAGTTWLAEDAIWLVVATDDKVRGWQGDRVTRSWSDGVTEGNPAVTLSPPHRVTLSSQIALKITFPGSNPDVRIEPFEPLTTTVSYFIGNDPEQWRPAVPVWNGVRYVDLYPGVDLALGGHGDTWQLEAAPGAAVDQVRLQVEGANAATLVGDVLNLDTSTGDLALLLPAATFGLEVEVLDQAAQSKTFALQPADLRAKPGRTQALREPNNDPSDLIYSTYLGGSPHWDQVNAIAVDTVGRATVTGITMSDVFPTTPGAFDPTFGGGTCGVPPYTSICKDAFVARLSADGSTLEYSTYLGGDQDEWAYTIAVDAAGRATVAGSSDSPDFPTTPGAFDPIGLGSFVARLSIDGSALVFSTFFPGSVSGIAVDSAGESVLAGGTTATNFPVTPGAYDTTPGGGTCSTAPYTHPCSDAYVAHLSADGSAVVYGTYLGGSDDDSASNIAVDGSGQITVAGSTTSGNFPTTPGAYDRTFAGGTCGTAPYLFTCSDIFVTRFNVAGSALVYSTFLGSSDHDRVAAIGLDNAGQTTLTGSAASQDFPTTPGAYDTTFNGGPRCYTSTGDAYVTRLNANGSALVFSSFLGGSHGDEAFDVDVDSTGRATVVGLTCSVDFPTTPDAFDTSLGGYMNGMDGFVTRFDVNGQNLSYGTFLGGGQSERAFGVALDSGGQAIAAGMTASHEFPTTPGAFDPIYTPGLAGFIAKLDMDPYAPYVLAPIEHPNAGAVVSGTVSLSGYAIDRRSPSGTGVDLVHIYLDGPYGAGTIIGGATYGLDRTDIAAQYGERFGPSGWELAWDTAGLAPGVHRLYLYARRTTDNAWSLMDPHLVVVAGGRTVWLSVVLRRQ